jgi:hypothetical protein
MLFVGGEISRHDGVARKGTEHEVGAEGPGRGTWDLECGAKYEGEVDGRERVERIVKRMVHRGEEKGWKGCVSGGNVVRSLDIIYDEERVAETRRRDKVKRFLIQNKVPVLYTRELALFPCPIV